MPVTEQAKYEVGQELWVGKNRSISPIYVNQVGRKWVYYTYAPSRKGREYRFELRTGKLEHDGYGAHPGSVYYNKEDWYAEREQGKLTSQLRELFGSFGPLPSYLTLDHLRRMVAIVDEAKEATHAETEV